MTSEVSICNGALIKLGADTILALTDNNNRARTMNARYESVRDAELRRRRWRFSISRASLAALSAAPVSGNYAKQFQLPSDCLRILNVGDVQPGADLSDYRNMHDSAYYSLEGRKILTNMAAPLTLRYVAKITDASLFDPAFAEALSARLAWENCERITQSNTKRELAMSDYKTAIKEAIAANALEVPPQPSSDDTWVMARNQ